MSATATPATATPATATSADPNAPARLVIEDDIAWIHLDDPKKKVNTLSSRYTDWFEDTLDNIADQPLRGLVILSDKPGNFIAGADIEELQNFKEPAEVLEVIRRGHLFTSRFALLPYPVVAAIDGSCLGGGLELSLACDARVAADSTKTRLGVPEVNLGLFPGLGGTQRLPRLIGVADALDLILTGKQIDARRAKKMGLVDIVCHPLVLREAAKKAVAWGKPGKPGYRGPQQDKPKTKGFGQKAAEFLAHTPGANKVVFEKARATVMKKSGGHYPAPLKAIDVVKKGIQLPLGEALELEARGFAELVVGDVAKNLISIFFTKNAVEERARKLTKKAREVRQVGVLGAGFMGAGITQSLVHKDYEVVLKDMNHDALARGLDHCDKLFGGLVKRRKYTEVERKTAMSRILPTVDYQSFKDVPIVIEAVFEDLGVKQQVIREVEAAGPKDLIFASNTSTIPITSLAEASQRPENVIGMHFFSPVHKMPLLEIIRHEKTSDEALATTVEVGRRMGKTIIVVNDGPGFFTSRVLGPFVNEGLWLLTEGARIDEIDDAVKSWGWPVGPLALLDEVGIDIGRHAGQVMQDYAGSRAAPPPIFDRMIEEGRLGRKSKLGFYKYHVEPKRVDRAVYDLMGDWERRRISKKEIIERTWMQMLNEIALCIEDGIIENPKDIDIGVIFGFGFPPFRGGILREADRLGLDYIVGRLQGYADEHGERLEPAQLLKDMAQKGKTFHKD